VLEILTIFCIAEPSPREKRDSVHLSPFFVLSGEQGFGALPKRVHNFSLEHGRCEGERAVELYFGSVHGQGSRNGEPACLEAERTDVAAPIFSQVGDFVGELSFDFAEERLDPC